LQFGIVQKTESHFKKRFDLQLSEMEIKQQLKLNVANSIISTKKKKMETSTQNKECITIPEALKNNKEKENMNSICPNTKNN